MLNIIDYLPERFLSLEISDLHEIFSGPTLIHLDGRRKKPIFVSVLLHGNESTGFIAIQKLLRKYANKELPRSLSIFVGNIHAARHGHRRLDGQPDYNRIWHTGNSPENNMAARVLDTMRKLEPFVSLDVHNNSGLNPHYACVNRIDWRFFQLATVFSRRVVYFINPKGTSSMAFADICPSVTLECGQPGHTYGTEHVFEYIEGCMHLSKLPKGAVHEHDMELFHSVAMITVSGDTSFGFVDGIEDIIFDKDIDHMNFQTIPAGSVIGEVKDGLGLKMNVSDEFGNDVTNKYITLKNNKICTVAPMMPSMFTLDKEAIETDCFGYVLESLHLPDEL